MASWNLKQVCQIHRNVVLITPLNDLQLFLPLFGAIVLHLTLTKYMGHG